MLPASRPCGSCPYRQDVPSGIWHESEYDKLPAYDNDTSQQPAAVFMCHQQTGHLCAGWVAVHEMRNTLAFRLACITGAIGPREAEAVLEYSTDVLLFVSGGEAAAHGKRDIEHPSRQALSAMGRIDRKRRATA
jgi:hypothetical protein